MEEFVFHYDSTEFTSYDFHIKPDLSEDNDDCVSIVPHIGSDSKLFDCF
jgi:hypothetical protein